MVSSWSLAMPRRRCPAVVGMIRKRSPFSAQATAYATSSKARRLLRRRVSDQVFKALIADEQRQSRPATNPNKPLPLTA